MKLWLGTMPSGGTRPSREPVGKVGSAAQAGMVSVIASIEASITANIASAAVAATQRALKSARIRVDRMGIGLILNGKYSQLRKYLGGGRQAGLTAARGGSGVCGCVPRRMLKLIRPPSKSPPCMSKVDVPG